MPSAVRWAIGAASVGGAAVLAWGLLATSLSPAALDWADGAMLRGANEEAIAQYRAIADAGLLPSHRVAALQRGARLLDRMDGDRLEAAHWYTRLADHVGSHAERADALARAGSAYRAAGSPQASADAYYGAWEAAPEESDAPERLLAAAQSLALAGEGKRAMSVLEQLDAPSVADRLCLTRGDLLLEVGDLQGALEEYEEAARLASTDGIRVAARQGAASCLERLANLDEALVDLR